VDRKTKKLVEQLKSTSTKERYVAVLELGRTGNTELIPHIDKVATLDANPKVRKLATQAVRALNVIKQREDEEARQAQIAALDAEDAKLEIEPGAFGWGSIEDLIVEKEEPEEGASDWNYHQLGKKHQEEKAARAAEEAKNEKRRRWRYRRFLWIATLIVVTGLALTSYYRLYIYDRPENRADALERLQEWTDELDSTTRNYLTLLNGSLTEVNCDEFTGNEDYVVPETPKWAGTDEPHQDGLEAFFTATEQIEANLNEAHITIASLCDGNEGNTAWTVEYPNPINLIRGTDAAGTGGAAGFIDQANSALEVARVTLEAEETVDNPESE
jgi:hypothetical protein